MKCKGLFKYKCVGGVKIHPKEVIKRKETPPNYSTNQFTRLRKMTQIKILGIFR